MRVRTLVFVTTTLLLWLPSAASVGAGPVERLQDSLPAGASGRLGSLRLRCPDGITCMAFSPDGKYLAAGGGAQFRDYAIDLFDRATGNLVRRLVGHLDRYWSLVFTPDGSMLISGGADGIRYWGIFHGEVVDTRDVITFEGRSVDELKMAFKDSIDDYLAFCQQRGEEPNKPFSGRFITRVPPELHRQVNLAATMSGKSLNAWVAEQLQAAVARSESMQVGKNKRKARRTERRA